MQGLLPTRASRAWFVVALVGLVVVVLVLGLGLPSRLGAGQDVIDAAKPAFTSERVAGDRAGVDFISRYVDLIDPLATARGGAAGELAPLIRFISRRTKRSQAKVAADLRREAPHIDALLRALPLSRAAGEVRALTGYLATVLNISQESLAAEFERSFPKLAQTLTAMPSVTTGWNDIPGITGLTRVDGTTPVKTVPQLRDYLSKDLVASVEANAGDFRKVAAHGGIGSIPRLLLVLAVIVLAFGLWQVRRSRDAPPGKASWAVVVAIGLLVVGLVGARQYFPRLNAADRVVSGLDPAFAQARVQGDRAAADMLHQTVLFGDPIATKRGGAGAELPALLSFVSQRTSIKRGEILAALRRRAPRLTALLQAVPLSAVASEVPHLLTYLGRTLKLRRGELLAALQRRTPAIAQSLLNVRPVAIRWNSIPGTGAFARFDGTTPVRTMPALDQYFSGDVVSLLEQQRANFRDLADPWPPLKLFAPLLLGTGALLLLYGLLMMRFAVPRRSRR
jgi:hypothetical protein